MLRNRSCRPGFVGVRTCTVLLRTVGLALFFGTVLLPAAQAQNANGQEKPLPAKSNPTVFYTPEGQQQIADAILTDAVDQLWVQADAHFHKGEYNHYINLSRVIVQGEPRNVEAFSNAAYLLWSTGQNEAAIAFLKQGLASNSDSYYMYDELGSFYYYHLKDYPSASVYYEKAIKYDCPFFTWSGLAHSYEKLNQWEKAVKAWEQGCNYFTAGVAGGTGKPNSAPARSDRSINDTMKHNLARAKAELARRQKQL